MGAVHVGLLVVVVGAAVLVGRALRHRWWPTERGAAGGIATALTSTAVLVVAAQVLGLVGAFGLVGLAAMLVPAAALAARDLEGTWGPVRWRGPSAAPREALAWALVAAVAVQWTGGLVRAVRDGVVDADAFHYHLTHAAWFVQTGRLFDVRPDAATHPAPWYPATDEVLRALGLAATGVEVAGLAVNVLAAGLLFVSARVVGDRVGRGPEVLAGTALLLGSPLFGPAYAGWVHNDWTAVAFLGAAIAVATAAAPDPRGAWWIVGAGIGLAAGTRWGILPAVGLVVVGLLALLGADRVRAAVRIVTAAAVVAGGWALRNVLDVGTPVPGLPGAPGPVALDPEARASVAGYLDDPAVVRDWFVPGLDAVFGALWLVLLLGLLVGSAWTLWRGRAEERWMVVAGAGALVAYLVTPSGAVGPPDQPVLFAANLRYAWPGLVLLSWGVLRTVPPGVGLPVVGAVAAVALAPVGAWGGEGWRLVGLGAAAGAVAAVLAPVAVTLPRWAVPLACVVLVLVLAGPASWGYADRRWRSGPDTYPAHEALFVRATDTLDGRRVGVLGWPMHYPFMQAGLTADVQALARRGPDGVWVAPRSCDELAAFVASTGRDVVAILRAPGQAVPSAMDWATGAPGARVLAASAAGAVVDLADARLDDACGRSTT